MTPITSRPLPPNVPSHDAPRGSVDARRSASSTEFWEPPRARAASGAVPARFETRALLLLVGCGVLGATAARAFWPSALVALLAVVLHHRALRWWMGLLCVACFALSHLRASRALSQFLERRQQLIEELPLPARCMVSAAVESSPQLRDGTLSYVVDASEVDCAGSLASGPVRVLLHGGPAELRRGDHLVAYADLAPVSWFDNPDAGDALPGAARRGELLSGVVQGLELTARSGSPLALIDAARHFVRARIDATYSPPAIPLARALVLGENDLDLSDDRAFKRSGLAHLLAVSGTHLVLAIVALVRGLKALLVRCYALASRYDVERLAAALGIPLALGYADFAGGSGSAWRAAWMLCVLFGARALGRRSQAWLSLAAASAVALGFDALAPFDISFTLSAAATSGLVLCSGLLRGRLARLTFAPLRWLAEALAATASAVACCLPFMALLSPSFTVIGLLANLVAGPIGELAALPVCLFHALLSCWPEAEKGAALVGSGALLLVRSLAHHSAAVSWACVSLPRPGPWHLALLACALLLLVWLRGGHSRRAHLLVAVGAVLLGFFFAMHRVEAAARDAGHGQGRLRITAIDIGQGDSLLVDFPDDEVMLIDGGGAAASEFDPAERVLLPLLRGRRRDHVNVVVVTHPHPDHATGVLRLLGRIPVDELWLPTLAGEGSGVLRELERAAAQAGARVRTSPELCAAPRQHGGVTLSVLSPCPAPLPGDNLNDWSLVLHLRYGRRAAMLTGDAEATVEQRLLARLPRDAFGADLLKLGHHGSRTSSSDAFLDAVHPTLGIISVGARNRHGHPHDITLAKAARHHLRVLRTDQWGSVSWTTDGSAQWLESARVPDAESH